MYSRSRFPGYWRNAPLVIFCVGALFALGVSAGWDERSENERRLVFDLFDKDSYNPLIRPVRNTNESLGIRFALALSQIITVDEVNQVMKTNVWLQVYWFDYQLKWDPTLYGNIDSIRIKPEKVWVPDFVLFNNADGNYEVTYKSNCVLYHTSEVHWIPPAIYQSSCLIDVQYFPFDQQRCEMKFGSWTHKGLSLKYTFDKNRDKLDLGDYLKSGSWDIIECPGEIVTVTDDVTGDKREQIIFYFVLRRKTLFYTVNLIIPCVLISFVSVCVFALPADAGEKITLCISVLLALVVFLLLVSKILPPSLTVPLIAKYLLFTFIMNLIAILCTVVVINRNYRTPRTHRMPYWMRVLFLKELPKYLLMKRPDHEERWREIPSTPSHSRISTPDVRRLNTNLNVSSNLVELTEMHRSDNKVDDPGTPLLQRQREASESSGQLQDSDVDSKTAFQRDSVDSSQQLEMTPELHKTIESVKFIYHHLKSEEEYETVLEDWKYVARVMDRLLLIIFLTVGLSGTASMFLGAPHILQYVDQDKIIDDLAEYFRLAEERYNNETAAAAVH